MLRHIIKVRFKPNAGHNTFPMFPCLAVTSIYFTVSHSNERLLQRVPQQGNSIPSSISRHKEQHNFHECMKRCLRNIVMIFSISFWPRSRVKSLQCQPLVTFNYTLQTQTRIKLTNLPPLHVPEKVVCTRHQIGGSCGLGSVSFHSRPAIFTERTGTFLFVTKWTRSERFGKNLQQL